MGIKRWNRQAREQLGEPVLVGASVQPRGALSGRLISYLLGLIQVVPGTGNLIDPVVEMISIAQDRREGRKTLSVRLYRQMYLVVGPTKLGLHHLKGVFRKTIGRQVLLVAKGDVNTVIVRRRLAIRTTIELADGATVAIESGRLQLVGPGVLELESGFWTRRRGSKIAAALGETGAPIGMPSVDVADTRPAVAHPPDAGRGRRPAGAARGVDR